ncbi:MULTISPECIES: branched-chain amino acid transaminase [unclassified Beijerinckia]|uniref:branched-chain amino acid transaminase n=1 Tax=unclassified Beijerinckia TaxID=2638183 RepID=UPI000897645E|nr:MULTISPECIES: branched-chain amino acid transaminase [unclassified Beijerinckia]MDH7799226.1 branched-chain amino acid aminotransferase [Beijerinckia sp. GAS462]SED91419.1 branched-chain amino acid aminotransferase [Beijerinckia sp. 28-YEA-48]
MEKAEKVWTNGKIVDWNAAHVHLISNTLQYGFGVFEGIRCYKAEQGPSVFRLKEHLDRLRRSATILGFEVPFGIEELTEATRQVIRENKFEQCYIRPIAYIGYGGMGLAYEECKIDVSIAVWHWGEYVGKGTLENGSRARVSSYVRQHINTNMSKAKACGNYMLFQMARTEAKRDGYDEAILLDTNGYVAEGSVEHIFLVRDGALITPPLGNLLDGITRDSVIQLARANKMEVREELFSRDYMLTADEVFFVGTGAEVTPVVEIDNRKIGNGKRGVVTAAMQKAYFDVVYGRDSNWSEWRTPV